MSEISDLQKKLYYQCAKCGIDMAANNQGGLDLTVSGGYGDFTDSYREEVPTFRLCHRHAHKFANWLNNQEVLGMYWGHSHAGYEPGFWYGHPSWEQQTWLSHLVLFFHSFWKLGWKSAKFYFVEGIRSHINWSRVDINDRDSKFLWGRFIARLFFLDNHSKGFFYGIYRKLKGKLYDFCKKYYRSQTSLYSEIWHKALNDGFSESEKAYLKDLGLALAQAEEE